MNQITKPAPAQNKKIQQALAFEKERKANLSAGNFQAVLESYNRQDVFLPDNNSGQFWDERFSKERQLDKDDFAFQSPLEAWRVRKVLSLIDKNKTILNLGVGAGRLEARLLKKIKPKQYLGTDITKEKLNFLSQNWPAFEFIKANLIELPIEDESFNQVCLLEVLEHIQPNKTFKVLEEIQRVLKTGGSLFISVPLNEGLEKMLPDNPNSHLRLYSPELLQFELEQAGFRVEQVFFASAFAKHFLIKHFFNQFFHLRQPNNCLMVVRKA